MAERGRSRQWTLLVYMAGDNNLETYGAKDLGEMARVGSSQDVAIVTQFDRMSDQQTRRYYITADGDLEADCVAELPETNTGDPEALLDFITWASRAYPAKRYALVLWNHGTGWKDDDIYRSALRQGVEDRITRGQVRGLTSGRVGRALFSTTLERLVVEAAENERAILFDDSSADFLDNVELRSVLQDAAEHLGQPLDLLGLDACLMNMLEVHYQVRDLCRVVVGSQEIEPGDGWPYDAVLTHLTREPDMSPEDLGRAIVQAYVGFYQGHFPGLSVTQSAIRTAGIEALAGVLDALALALIDSLKDRQTLGLLFGALRSAQSFSDRDYVDLEHFCLLLSEAGAGRISEAARHVAGSLLGKESPVIAQAYHGPDVTHARGLSIYLPVRTLSPLYGRLEFAQQNHWDEFLDAFVNPLPTAG